MHTRPWEGGYRLAWTELDGGWTESDLTPAERTAVADLPSASRRTEWIAGRVAARAALAELHPGPMSVLRARNGAPDVVGPDAPALRVSITHSRHLALAIAGPPGPEGLGIDLMEPSDRPRIERVLFRFQKPDEARILQGGPGPFVAWGARESVAKATRTGMFRFAMFQVHVTGFDPELGDVQIGLSGYRIRWCEFEGRHLVVAQASSEACARAREMAAPEPDPAR